MTTLSHGCSNQTVVDANLLNDLHNPKVPFEAMMTHQVPVLTKKSSISRLAVCLVAGLTLSYSPILSGTEINLFDKQLYRQGLNHSSTVNNTGMNLVTAFNYKALTGADNMIARRQVIKAKVNKIGFQMHQPSNHAIEEVRSDAVQMAHSFPTKKIKAKVKKIGFVPHVIEIDDGEVQ